MDKRDMPLGIVCVLVLAWWMVSYGGCGKRPIDAATGNEPAPEAVAESVSAQESQNWKTAELSLPKDLVAAAALSEPEVEPELTAAVHHADFETLDDVQTVTLESEFADYVVDPNAGGVIGARLHAYRNEERTDDMELGAIEFPILAVRAREAASGWLFTKPRLEEHTKESVTFARGVIGHPLLVEQQVSLSPDAPYRLKYKLRVRNTGSQRIDLGDLRLSCGAMAELGTAKGFMGAGGMDQRLDLMPAGKTKPKTYPIHKIAKLKAEKIEELSTSEQQWVAVQNKYFASIVTPTGGFSGVELTLRDAADEAESELIAGYGFLESRSLAGGEYTDWEFDVHLGPKIRDVLQTMGQNQDRVMQFDLFMFFQFKWMEAISSLIFWLLLTFESYLPGYGWSIMALTVLIRTIFWPVTHRATMLSRRMQAVAPEMKELKEKYKDDPQRMQEKTWELYKTHKINPLAGCLPMVLQIPVFFALFNVLRNAIELRQESWLWVTDLSKPDTIATLGSIPLNPLAVTMGLSMFLQQYLTPSTADPNQKKMMQFMTIGFMFMLYTMPSGLTLYWTVNNIISIIQYRVTRAKPEGNDEQPAKS